MVDASAVARVLGIETAFKDLRAGGVLFLPQRVAILAQGRSSSVYSTTKRQITSSSQAGTIYGHGSPIHLMAQELLPPNGDGVGSIPVTVYPLEDGYDAVTALGGIVVSGDPTTSGEFRVRIGGVLSAVFSVEDTDSTNQIEDKINTAVNSVLAMPFVASGSGQCILTAKWAGPTANGILIEVVDADGESEAESIGITFTITQPTGGLVNPEITGALAQMGNVWETMLVHQFRGADTAVLDELQEFGEGRWGELVRKPLVAFYGTNTADMTTATSVPDGRNDDRINSQLPAPGSPNVPFVIAARELARIVKVANNNPARDYGSQKCNRLIPGDDGDQWDYPTRDAAVKNGSSTIEVRDGVIYLADVVTCYHPSGEEPPAYRYVCDIVKLQNIIFNLDLLFANEEWDGAPLIPDDQPTVNPDARKPRSAKALVAAMLDSLGLNAIISDPDTAKDSIVCSIDSGNPKRLNLEVTVQLAGNTNIKSILLNFGFFFGAQTAVA